jgi:hypothetical protein
MATLNEETIARVRRLKEEIVALRRLALSVDGAARKGEIEDRLSAAEKELSAIVSTINAGVVQHSSGHRADKLENLILYVALKCEAAPLFGRTKLAKILFFSDFRAYVDLGHPITGVTYEKREFGPLPAGLGQTETRLQSSRRAHERIVPAGPFRQHRLVALEAPDLSAFSADEIAIVDAVIEKYWDDSAADVNEYSDKFPAWRLVGLGQEIPYFSVLSAHQRGSPTDPSGR